MKKLIIIGFGNMGQAFYQGLKSKPNFEITGQDKNPEKLTTVGLKTATEADLGEADYLILAIKPQGLADFEISNLSPKTIVISILAGTSLEQLSNKFKNNKIVRCMPNLAIKNLNGVTGWYGINLTKDEQDTLNSIFECLGTSIPLKSEVMLDSLTLISGSGPGYIAYIANLLEREAVSLGFSDSEAKIITTQTLVGTTTLLQQQSSVSLVNQVSSKNGVTEAITNSLAQAQLPEIMHQALESGLKKINDLKK